jgi:hypothetical protein
VTSRGARLRASLLDRLKEASGQDGFTSRLRWLAGELENYVERWIGFGVAVSIAPSAMLGDDLTEMIDVAVEIIDGEAKGAPAEAWAAWQEVRATLAKVRACADWSEVPALRAALKHWSEI